MLLSPTEPTLEEFMYHGYFRPSTAHVDFHASLLYELLRLTNLYSRALKDHSPAIQEALGMEEDENIVDSKVLPYFTPCVCFRIVEKEKDEKNFPSTIKSSKLRVLHEKLPSPSTNMDQLNLSTEEQERRSRSEQLVEFLDKNFRTSYFKKQILKVHYMVREQFYHDVISTVNKYGLNPKLKYAFDPDTLKVLKK